MRSSRDLVIGLSAQYRVATGAVVQGSGFVGKSKKARIVYLLAGVRTAKKRLVKDQTIGVDVRDDRVDVAYSRLPNRDSSIVNILMKSR